MPELSIEDISKIFVPIDVTNARFGGTKLWWHGMGNSSWELKPSVYHQNMFQEEHNLSVKFINRARARHRNCPESSAFDDCLFLMQHFGLPTRLLDWSESILVALYFAVEDEKQYPNDGIIYGLQPSLFNLIEISERGIPASGEVGLSKLFREALLRPANKSDNRIVAVLSDHVEMRHLVQ